MQGPIEGTAGNYSMNGSGSGSNGQNGCSLGLNTALTNTESDNKGCADAREASGKMGGNAVPEDRAAQREAALSKFRQKRKDRSFEKKVRYQSRKRLAEQRPRVKGQFARQSMSDNKSGKK